MKISVITVLFNAADVIGGAMMSLQVQSHTDIEQIIVDGGSTDDSMNIVSAHVLKNSKVISEKDGGIYDAMNKGVRMATGDAVLFLNADDRLAQSDAIKDLVAALENNSEAGFVFGDVVVRDGDRDIYKSHSRIDRSNIGFNMICHQAMLARRELFEEVGSFDTNYRICADLDWMLRCVDQGVGFQHVPRLVAYYAGNGESERNASLRKTEKSAILSRYRSTAQRVQQKLSAAVRRRLSGTNLLS